MQLFDAKIINKIQVIGPLGKKIHKAGVQYYFMTILFKLLDTHGQQGLRQQALLFLHVFCLTREKLFFLVFSTGKERKQKDRERKLPTHQSS